MGPRARQFYSYLTGLAPVGEDIAVNIPQICADMGWRHKTNFPQMFKKLLWAGVARHTSPKHVQVLKHYEEWQRGMHDSG